MYFVVQRNRFSILAVFSQLLYRTYKARTSIQLFYPFPAQCCLWTCVEKHREKKGERRGERETGKERKTDRERERDGERCIEERT
jgi:hypothetical protein